MDARLLQALRLLMDVTLSELSDTEAPRPAEDVRTPETFDRTAPPALTDSVPPPVWPDAAPARRAQAASGTAFSPHLPEAEALSATTLMSQTIPEVPFAPPGTAADMPPTGTVWPRRPAFPADMSPAAPSPTATPLLPDRPDGVRGTLSLQDISDHFEQDARRY